MIVEHGQDMSARIFANTGAWDMRFLQSKRLRLFFVVGSCALLVACSATFRNHGYVPTAQQLENVLVGVDTRGTVSDIVGRPSSTGVLQDGGWYYISSRVRHYAFRQPEVIERELLAISFDEQDVVSNIEHFGLQDGRVITFSRRVTSSGVKGPGFFAQILGNIGNFGLEDLIVDE